MQLVNQLELERCPHCSVRHPRLGLVAQAATRGHSGANPREWRFYGCATCGGVVTAAGRSGNPTVIEYYPQLATAADEIPERARTFLSQAIESLHAPAGAVMLAAKSVDSMLQARDYKKGSLYERIDQAAKAHLITSEMAEWAHEVRLDANEQRHAAEAAPLPDESHAGKCIEFARALGEFLFVLPARVERGRKPAAP